MLLKNRYKIIRQLGRGASGVTLLANDETTSQEVVIKRFFVKQISEESSWKNEIFFGSSQQLGEIDFPRRWCRS